MNAPSRFLGALLAIPFAASAQAADWPAWRGKDRTAVTSESVSPAKWGGGPPKAWEKEVGIGSCAVSVSEGLVYTAGNDETEDTIYCLDAKTGNEVWKFSYEAPLLATQFEGGPAATPSVDGGRVYMLSREGLLHCLNAKTGKPVWKVDLVKDLGGAAPEWKYSTSPLIEGRMVIVEPGGKGSSVAALDKATGRTIWKAGDDPVSYSSPVAFTHNGKRYVAVFNVFGLVVRAAANGAEVARHPWKTSYDINSATPIVLGDEIFISSGYGVGGALLKFDGKSLREVWKNDKMRNQFTSSVLWKDHIYGFDDQLLRCLDWKTGESQWDKPGMGKAALIVADGKLVIMSENGDLVVAEADPSGYKELAQTKAVRPRSWVMPVLADGRLYGKNNRGDLVSFDVGAK